MNDSAATEQTTTTTEPDGWEWAIVEIFGHRRHAGKASEEERFGAKMLRIDVPLLDHSGDTVVSWTSHYYGGGSLFSYTTTDEKTVMRYATRRMTPALPFRDHGTEHEYAFEADQSDDDDVDGDDA